MDAAPLVEGSVAEGADLLHESAAMRPLDKRHAEDDADDHADGGDRVAERNAVLPAEGRKRLRHAADRTVSAFEADLKEVAERRGNAAPAHEDEAREPKADHVLSPGDDLPETQLRKRAADDLLQPRRRSAEEKRREDDVDHESGNRPHAARNLSGSMLSERRHDDQPENPANHG